jgi:hypothetical protein
VPFAAAAVVVLCVPFLDERKKLNIFRTLNAQRFFLHSLSIQNNIQKSKPELSEKIPEEKIHQRVL